jgi:hypothetical protein
MLIDGFLLSYISYEKFGHCFSNWFDLEIIVSIGQNLFEKLRQEISEGIYRKKNPIKVGLKIKINNTGLWPFFLEWLG